MSGSPDLKAVMGRAPNRSTRGSASRVQLMGMKVLSSLLAFTLPILAGPAFATGGLLCRTAEPQPVEIALVVSHTTVSSIVSARLTDNGAAVPVALAQSWLEPNELRLDLTDTNAMRHELRLRATRNGATFDGSLWRSGKRRWVRCREE